MAGKWRLARRFALATVALVLGALVAPAEYAGAQDDAGSGALQRSLFVSGSPALPGSGVSVWADGCPANSSVFLSLFTADQGNLLALNVVTSSVAGA